MKKASAPLRVIADDREPSAVLEALRMLPGVEVSVARLKLGDYRVDGALLAERKTLADFAVSVIDGRLFSQASRLAKAKERGLLILEGKASCLTGTGIRREALQGALITVSLIFGIPVLRSEGPEETARLILYAGNQTRAFAAGALHRPGLRPKGKLKTQIRILQGLPGVGPDRAQKLLATYGSVEGVLRADVASLKKVPGIGKKTAEAIRWSVTESAANYYL
jgi:ERCC4-type nuclease